MKAMVAIPLCVLITAASGCVIGVSDSGFSTFDEFDDEDDKGVQVDKSAERTETLALDLDLGQALDLDLSYGDIEVKASDEGGPRLQATIHASGRTLEEARAVLARYDLEVEHGADAITVRLVGEPLVVRDGKMRMELGAHADFVVRVPDGTAIDARSGSGDIRAKGTLGALRLETGYGSVSIEQASGHLEAKSGSGNVRADQVEADEIELTSGYGDVRLGEARAQRIELKSGSGNVRIEAAEADEIELDTEYGSVHVRAAIGAVHARSGSGDVRLHDVEGSVDATSGYGTVEIAGVVTGLSASSGSGNVEARIRSGSRNDADWTLTSSYGSVVLEVPANFGCQLDARTGYGSVECDFPVTIEAGKKKSEGKLKGRVGKGGGTVTLSSGSGDVVLRKL